MSGSDASYQLQKAMKKPNHEKKNTRPYLLIGFSTGMLLAFWLIGLIAGALHKLVSVTMMAMCQELLSSSRCAVRRLRASSYFMAHGNHVAASLATIAPVALRLVEYTSPSINCQEP